MALGLSRAGLLHGRQLPLSRTSTSASCRSKWITDGTWVERLKAGKGAPVDNCRFARIGPLVYDHHGVEPKRIRYGRVARLMHNPNVMEIVDFGSRAWARDADDLLPREAFEV